MNQTHLLTRNLSKLFGYKHELPHEVEELTMKFEKCLTSKARVSIRNESTGDIILPEKCSEDMKTFTFLGKFAFFVDNQPEYINTVVSNYQVHVDFYDWLPIITLNEIIQNPVDQVDELPLQHKAVLKLGRKLVGKNAEFTGFIEQVDTVSFEYDYHLNQEFPKVNYSNVETIFIETVDTIDGEIGKAIIKQLKKLPKVTTLCFDKHYADLCRFISSETFVREVLDMGISLSFWTVFGVSSSDRITIKLDDGLTLLVIQNSVCVDKVRQVAKCFCALHEIDIHRTCCEITSFSASSVNRLIELIQEEENFDKIIVGKSSGDCSIHIDYYGSPAKSARF